MLKRQLKNIGFAVLFVVMQLILDFVYMLVDPRIRVGASRK